MGAIAVLSYLRCRRSAIKAVQPVWWLAPTPLPYSPRKLVEQGIFLEMRITRIDIRISMTRTITTSVRHKKSNHSSTNFVSAFLQR